MTDLIYGTQFIKKAGSGVLLIDNNVFVTLSKMDLASFSEPERGTPAPGGGDRGAAAYGAAGRPELGLIVKIEQVRNDLFRYICKHRKFVKPM
ncbi:hypothetical protein [Methylobacterium nonmethylotrophicum]|uniref:hypothetical protein n=1 Tax=Methylobacterium nonmethylotrophicum TaxID=1141884 RepID=UPI0014367976|nr:hypothetical protein [Methylobacterium nonmethylotrophicum]